MVDRTLSKIRRRAEHERAFRRLGRENGRVQDMYEQLKAASRGTFSPAERDWIDRIGRLRWKLEVSRTPVEKVDYGAGGNVDLQRDGPEAERAVEATKTVGAITKTSSNFLGTVLFRLARGAAPTSAVELGTSVGLSAAYQAAALNLNGDGGTLTTLEGAPAVARVAREVLHRRLGLDNVEVVTGRFQDTLRDVLRRKQPVDYVFVDGHHDGAATVEYFEMICAFAGKGALLVFDDIAWSDDMKRAWETIAADPCVHTSIDLGPMGLCILDDTPAPEHYTLPLRWQANWVAANGTHVLKTYARRLLGAFARAMNDPLPPN
jgi:predicted O-methyltransferase YrrM